MDVAGAGIVVVAFRLVVGREVVSEEVDVVEVDAVVVGLTLPPVTAWKAATTSVAARLFAV